MLCKLAVKNYALIDELEVEFQDGFNVITGETGSGKSLLLGALGLILGKQADYSMLRNANKKCISEAHFNLKGIHLSKFFQENDIDEETETIIRRELSPNGKSRAFINDTPVNLQTLKEFSNKLIDIHSQNEHVKLSGKPFLYHVLDSFSELEIQISQFQFEHKKFKELEEELKLLKSKEEQLKADRDYYAFQLKELNEIDFSELNIEEIEAELHKLSNAESIKSSVYQASQLLSSEFDGALIKVKESLNGLDSLNLDDLQFSEIIKNLNQAYNELDDSAFELHKYGEHIQPDKERLDQLTSIQNTINTLLIKHRSKTVEALSEKKERFELLLNKAENFDQEILELQRKIESKHNDLSELTANISEIRTKNSLKLSAFVNAGLRELGMPNAELKVTIDPSESFNEYGKNDLSFLIKTNKGSEFSDLSKVASGGELSRIMFLIKAAVASKKQIATLVLDEIDSGISGEVASKLATQIREMGSNSQLIVVSHLAQMASKAHAHFKISKYDDGENTFTELESLNSQKDRVNELAILLSGEEVTDAALQNAKSLLEY